MILAIFSLLSMGLSHATCVNGICPEEAPYSLSIRVHHNDFENLAQQLSVITSEAEQEEVRSTGTVIVEGKSQRCAYMKQLEYRKGLVVDNRWLRSVNEISNVQFDENTNYASIVITTGHRSFGQKCLAKVKQMLAQKFETRNVQVQVENGRFSGEKTMLEIQSPKVSSASTGEAQIEPTVTNK